MLMVGPRRSASRPPCHVPGRTPCPFSSERRFMATTHVDPDGDTVVTGQGRGRAGARPLHRTRCAPTATRAARAGRPRGGRAARRPGHAGARHRRALRRTARTPRPAAAPPRSGLVFVGLQAMLDPPRRHGRRRRAHLPQRRARREDDHRRPRRHRRRPSPGRSACSTTTTRAAVLTGAELDRDRRRATCPAAVERAAVFARVTPSRSCGSSRPCSHATMSSR